MHPVERLLQALREDRQRSAWSRADTLAHRAGQLAGEVEEVRAAVALGNRENLHEELGDAFWDLLFLVVLAEEAGVGTLESVVEGALGKLRRRKPWLATGEQLTLEEEVARWAEAKRLERSPG